MTNVKDIIAEGLKSLDFCQNDGVGEIPEFLDQKL